MEITTLPLTDTYFITLFQGRGSNTYSISSDSGNVLYNYKYIETGINERFSSHKMFGKVWVMTEEQAVKILEQAGLQSPYINYTDRTQTFDSALDSFKSFIVSQNWDLNDNTWLIIPKPSKQLKGKKMMMEFNVGALDFGHGREKMELEIFMSAITKTSKSVTFSMMIPEFIYDKCMTDPEVNLRPKEKHIEGNTISILHHKIESYVSQAHGIWCIEKDAKNAKKVICINFTSQEQTTRDDYNHAYTGQKISTSFNFFVGYKTSTVATRTLFTFKKYQTGAGSTEKGIKGIIDFELSGNRQWMSCRPQVIIDWTQEREDFLTQLEDKFRKLSENLNSFLKDLNEEKIEHLITNKELLRLN